MATWSFSPFSFEPIAVADCGPYTGPWPPLAPSWAALAPFTKRQYWDTFAQNVTLTYITALPPLSGNPLDFENFDDPTGIVTFAQMGSFRGFLPGGGRGDLQAQLPSYFWNYDRPVPAYSLVPPRHPGIHLFVRVDWFGLFSSSGPVKALVASLNPLSLVPANYASGGTGPAPSPNGLWSDWQPQAAQGFDLIDFNQELGSIDNHLCYTDSFTSATHSTFAAAMADARAQLLASIPGTVHNGAIFGAPPPYSTAYFANDPGGNRQVGALRAWQYAEAFDIHADLVANNLDVFTNEPDGMRGIFNEHGGAPDYWGSSDPDTIGGWGWQWEARQGQFQDLQDGTRLVTFGFTIASGYSGPHPLLEPACPMRIYAREYTGPVAGTEWLPADGHAFHLGDFSVASTAMSFFTSSVFGIAAATVRFSQIPWPRFWLITAPAFAFSGGAAPSPPAWVDSLVPPNSGSQTCFWDGPLSSLGFFFTNQHFGSLILRGDYVLPRWRYWKPVFVGPALRLNQRDDGLGVRGHPRLKAGNGASSHQLAVAPRVGISNTYS